MSIMHLKSFLTEKQRLISLLLGWNLQECKNLMVRIDLIPGNMQDEELWEGEDREYWHGGGGYIVILNCTCTNFLMVHYCYVYLQPNGWCSLTIYLMELLFVIFQDAPTNRIVPNSSKNWSKIQKRTWLHGEIAKFLDKFLFGESTETVTWLHQGLLDMERERKEGYKCSVAECSDRFLLHPLRVK